MEKNDGMVTLKGVVRVWEAPSGFAAPRLDFLEMEKSSVCLYVTNCLVILAVCPRDVEHLLLRLLLIFCGQRIKRAVSVSEGH